MLRSIWRALVTLTLILGVLLTFGAVIDLIRAYQVLYALHPVAGYLFLALLGSAVSYLVFRYVVTVFTHPRILMPPSVGDPAQASPPVLRRYARFLTRLSRRLGENDALSEERGAAALESTVRLRAALREDDPEALREIVIREEKLGVRPAIDELERRAKREVRDCVRDVMLGVALSPWRSADLAVTIYRNSSMVMRIIRIFDNRPTFREQFLILKDILWIVATVNFLNFGTRLIQNLSASVPVLGRLTDDIAQGVGAGLMTSVAGHTAVERCGSFRDWDRIEASKKISKELGNFLADIRRMVTTDLLPEMRKPIEAQLPRGERKPGTFDRLSNSIEKAMDETAEALNDFLRNPVIDAGTHVASRGAAIGRAAGNSGRWLHLGVQRTKKAVDRTLFVAGDWLRRAGALVVSPFRGRRGRSSDDKREKDQGKSDLP